MQSVQNPSRSRMALKNRGDAGEFPQKREAIGCPIQMEKGYGKWMRNLSKSKESLQKIGEPISKKLMKHQETEKNNPLY